MNAIVRIMMVLALLSFSVAGASLAESQASAVWCHDFKAGIRIGDSGGEVSALQHALSAAGFYDGRDRSGYFGEHTASAVSAFQERYSGEILEPYGLKHGTGYVSQATAEKLNSLYGCQKNRPPVIYGVSGPASLNAGQSGTWTIEAGDPEGGNLRYSVSWGDERSYTDAPDEMYGAVQNVQKATFTHAYSEQGTYTVRFRVSDEQGLSAESSITVVVAATPGTGSMEITVIGGDGRECPAEDAGHGQTEDAISPWYCGAVLYDAYVSVYSHDGRYYGTKDTSSGTAVFENLPAGGYTARAIAQGYASSSSAFYVQGGDAGSMTITLNPLPEPVPLDRPVEQVQQGAGRVIEAIIGAVSWPVAYAQASLQE